MQDHGAALALSFWDAGLPSTTHTDSCIVAAAKGVLAELNRHTPSPDAIIVEFGDGIMGHYGVEWLLRDRELMSHVRAHILCANDLVGAWGGLQYLQDDLGLEVDCISGPGHRQQRRHRLHQQHMNKPAANGRNGARPPGRYC